MTNKWIKQYAIIAFIAILIFLATNIDRTPSSDYYFEDSLKFVLKWEGGYHNDPNDPGGETNFGICKKWYPHEDIKNMTVERATKIYYENYWLRAGCDRMDFPFNIIVFDTSVNMGVRRAKDFLEESENWQDYLLIRIQFYTKLSTAKYFLRGWVNRVSDLYNLIEGE